MSKCLLAGLYLNYLILYFREGMNITPRAMLKCPWPLEKTMFNESNILIHSWYDNKSCHIGDNVILEYTFLPGNNNIGSNCIVSNTKFPSSVSVPSNSFLHTVVITDEEAPLYITVAFGIEDDLKKLCPSRDATNHLTYSGLKFGDALDKLHIFQVSLIMSMSVNIHMLIPQSQHKDFTS